MKINALGACHPECRFCAQEWYKWWRGRDKQMSMVRPGQGISFAEAAVTSIKAP